MSWKHLGGSARVALLALVLALGVGTRAQARAGAPTCSPKGPDASFALGAQALTGPAGTDVYATVTSLAAGCPAPDVLKKVQVKALAADGSTDGISNYFDVPAAGGRGAVAPAGLSRGQRLEVTALVQTPEAVRTTVLNTETSVRLRPDLVATLVAPSRVVRKQPFAAEAKVSEIAGDTAASAVVSLYDGSQLLAAAPVSVAAGGTTTVPFASLRIPAVGSHELQVRIDNADPAELDTTNDTANAAVAVAMYNADGAVVSENAQATKIGADVLRAGGNAIDAAAAVQWALNVVEPENTGLGGGVTAVVHLADGEDFAIDGRETAPAAVTPDYFRTKTGVDRNGFGIGVPGTLRTVDYMLSHWGTMTLAQTLEPATQLAVNGAVVSQQLSTSATNRGGLYSDTAAIFRPGGKPVQAGDILRQPDLAKTFRLIAEQGPAVFYDGEIADAIVAAQQESLNGRLGGVMTRDDLKAYAVDVRSPVSVDYRGYKVESIGQSTCGGIVALQMLKMVERFPLGSDPDWGFQSPNSAQVMLEALRLSTTDRNMWMGDPRFFGPDFPMPADKLLDPRYLAQRSSLIDPHKRMATPPPGLFVGSVEPQEFVSPDHGGDTSHMSIVDRWGNVVSFTTSLADGLGTTITVPGYGFLLNDSNRNYNQVPQAGKVKRGIVDPGANDAAGGKRAMGNTAPVIVLKDGEPVLVTGAAGGAQIWPVVFQIVSNVVDFHMTVQQAVEAPRLWGDESNVFWNGAADPVSPYFSGAPAFPDATLKALAALGDPLVGARAYPQVGGAQSVAVDPNTYALSAAADPRGLVAVGAPIVLAPR